MPARTPSRVRERGAMFIIVAFLALGCIGLVGAALTASLGKVRHVETRLAETAAFNAAESGLNTLVHEAWTIYRNQDPLERVEYMDRLDGKYDESERLEILDRTMGRSRYSAFVRQARVVGGAYADLEFHCEAVSRGVTSAVSSVVRFELEPSEVFDHAYFINNYGWLWGRGITVNGSSRSNGNLSVRDPKVNGDLFASENPTLGAAGTVVGGCRRDSLADYNDDYGTRARPSNPSAPSEDLNGNGSLDAGEDANFNGRLDTYEYGEGYDGNSERHEHQAAVEMPYLGELDVYRDLAIRKGGTLRQGDELIVDAVLGDDPGEPRDLLLVGTEDEPIRIDGPIVVTNDVVIRGFVTGLGTIYAGRNVHIIGDIEYADPPVWEKPLHDQEAARERNLTKDMFGLAAKGSVVLGDYTKSQWRTYTRVYQRPPFTQPYEVDPSDDAIGYVSYYDGDGRPTFDGDYTDYDGGRKDALGDADAESRRYYESSFPDHVISHVARDRIERVDAIVYTNHLFTGLVKKGVFNGSIVSRDEAVIYWNSIEFNYDIRVRNGGYEFIDIYLPREPSLRRVSWSQP